MAVVVLALEVGFTAIAARHQPARRPLDVLAIALLAAGAAALPVGDRYPRTVLGVTFGTTLAYWLLDYPGGPVFIALIVALFTAIIRGERIFAWATLAVGFVAFQWLPALVGNEPKPKLASGLALGAWLLVLGGSAEFIRVRRQRALDIQRAWEEGDRRRASEERLRIARELHDVLAHNISMINVQAGVALHLMDERPEQARTALAAIKDASKDALGELRSVLDILRSPGDADPREPVAGLDRLDELISKASATGLSVHADVEGTPRPLPRGVDLAAFRIVQEALTNVIRHAGASTAVVTMAYSDDGLTIRIDDNGRGVDERDARGGSGIVGMRERAVALGGQLEAGPSPDGGFRVLARLPLDDARTIG